ncbi:MAG: hypothetical protein HS115_04325 [Spirochaetales bacterium]|nr:hypothetical protein [Spirochaetales bacterium]
MKGLLLSIIILTLMFCRSQPVTEGSPADQAPAGPPALPGEPFLTVRYIVGETAITDRDIESIALHFKGTARQRQEKSVQMLIERAIIDREARNESIIVSDARLEHEINQRMQMAGISSEEAFRKSIERDTGMDFKLWKDELRYILIRQQLVQIKLNVPRPEDSEVETFYRKNRHRIGEEVRFREILLRPSSGSLDEERRISSIARETQRALRGNPALFSGVARTLADNSSPRRAAGGLYDYMAIHEVAEKDRVIAAVLHTLRRGQVSEVFRDRRGNYVILYLENKRPVPIDRIRELIRNRLYFEKEQEVFSAFLEERKKETVIREVP